MAALDNLDQTVEMTSWRGLQGQARAHSRRLAEGNYAVGGSLVNDIALAGCAYPHIVSLQVRPLKQDAIIAESLVEDLKIDGFPFPLGDIRALKSGSVLTIGDVAITLKVPDQAPHGVIFSQAMSASAPTWQRTRHWIAKIVKFNELSRLSTNILRSLDRRSRFFLLMSLACLVAGIAYFLLATFTVSGKANQFATNTYGMIEIADPANYLSGVLLATDLSHLVSIVRHGDKFTLQGEVTRIQAERLKSGLGDFTRLFPRASEPELRLLFAPGSDHGARGILFTPNPFLIDEGGQLISPGGTLKSGWRFVDINHEGAALAKGAARQIYRMPMDPVSTGSIGSIGLRGSFGKN